MKDHFLSQQFQHQEDQHRIVLLFDLDCFYAQCERVRLGLEVDCSLALLQWNSTLAVTYPARKFGIKRGDSWDVIAQKSKGACHAIHLHVLQAEKSNSEIDPNTEESIGPSNEEDVELESQDENLETAFEKMYKLSPEQQMEARKQLGVRVSYCEGKACLERYRIASMRIFSVVLESLTKHLGGKDQFILERASIDEFYLDITKYCYRNLLDNKARPANSDQQTNTETNTSPQNHNTVVVGDASIHKEDQSTLKDALNCACQVSDWIRSDVWDNLGFTMSAGISANKMMAKLAASYGKPNGQAVLHPHNFDILMKMTNIRKVRHFGGKLGKQVIQKVLNGKEDATMGELAQVPLPVLLHHFSSETGHFMFNSCRGVDMEEVKETTGALVKSITAFKSFTATANMKEIQKWLTIIANEIVTRVAKDMVRNKRYPKTCTLSYTYYTTSDGKRPQDGSHRSQRNTRSVRLQYPIGQKLQKAQDLQTQALKKLLPIISKHPLRGVGMSANNFETKGQPPAGVASINSFFSAAEKSSSGKGEKVTNATTKNGTSSMLRPAAQKNQILAGVGKSFTPVAETTLDTAKGTEIEVNIQSSSSIPEKSISIEEQSDVEFATRLQASFDKDRPLDCDKDKKDESRTEGLSNLDDDMELARKLQTSYDRENYVLTASIRRTSTGTPPKKKVRRIDTFFQRR